MKVLLIEDNQEITELISVTFRLGWPGAVIETADTGEAGVAMVEASSPDIVILDIGLPDISGFEVLRRIRHFSYVPVIILTGEATTEIEEVKGFESGADDYILKPFRPIELVSRVKNALSHIRVSESQVSDSPLAFGNLVIDTRSRQVLVDNNPLNLSPIEYNLLLCLAKNAGRALTREDILRAVWGTDFGEPGTIKMAIHRLRRKLGEAGINPEAIATVKGLGYKFTLSL